MRGSRHLSILALALGLGAANAHASIDLNVRSVVPPEVAERLRARGLGTGAAIMRPEELAAQQARERRWRAFPDFLSRPGVDWSSPVDRRLQRDGAIGPRLRKGSATPAAGANGVQTIRLAILRIDFLDDRGGSRSTGDGRFDLSGPDPLVPPIDRSPHNRTFYEKHAEALRRYYGAESYGRTDLETEVWPRDENGAYSVSDMADFGPWTFSQDIYPAALHMFRTMLFAADSQSIVRGDRIPWDSYDRIVLIHAGSDLQSDLRQDSPEDIPSFTIGVDDSDSVIFGPDSTNIPIDRASIIPETNNQDGFYGAINGVLAHECGHLIFGFFDVYSISSGLPVVGYWSLMDSGNLVGARVELLDGSEIFATGLLPPSIDPWHRRYTTDVLDPPEVDYGAVIPLENSERHPDMRRVTLSSDEYLLLENRFISPGNLVQLDQDSLTRVVLGPKSPDSLEYDALLPTRLLPDGTALPSGGILVWHVDESVIPVEYDFPIDTSLRANPDFGMNSNPRRLGLSVIEADALMDLGDLGSRYLLGAPYDPWFVSNNPTLSDTTRPPLKPNIPTRPHLRLDFLDDPGLTLRFQAARAWQLPGWPVRADFPPNGPQLLAVDADGDDALEVCWAGGDTLSADSTALFAVRVNGQGLAGPDYAFARLDCRPRSLMAALPIGASPGAGLPARGPAYFAATTYPQGPDLASPGGRVWLVGSDGNPLAGWPPALPALATTPPVVFGEYPLARIFVGCADGRVYTLDLGGNVVAVSDPPLAGGVSGRLAVFSPDGSVASAAVAAGGADGDVAVFGLAAGGGWPARLGSAGFTPDFLWISFGGNSAPAPAMPQLVVHHADRLWAFEPDGRPLPGWGRDVGDTLVASLGAGDPDGDGYPEVLTQSVDSAVGFFDRGGYPAPGWPKRTTTEHFRSGGAPLALDLVGDRRTEVVAMNASGILAALDGNGHTPAGWPLATGVGAMGSPVGADLDGDGSLEVVAPDHLGGLFAYTLPAPASPPPPDTLLLANAWPMVGGGPGRCGWLPPARTRVAPAPSAGPLVRGSLKAYPNPARRRPVSFAFRLSEPADVEFRILDVSGHEVASFNRAGVQSDNLEVWEPGNLPAGLYMAQLRFRGGGRTHVEMVPVGLLR